MTLQIYPCNSSRIFETWKRHWTWTTFEDWLWWRNLDSDKDINTNSRSDKDSATAGCASASQVHVWSRPQDTWNSGDVHPFTGGPSGM